MTYETITYEIADAVATITLNRPAAYNALDLTLAREIFAAALEADEDRGVRCVVVTGAGNAFCAGGDVNAAAGHFGWTAISTVPFRLMPATGVPYPAAVWLRGAALSTKASTWASNLAKLSMNMLTRRLAWLS